MPRRPWKSFFFEFLSIYLAVVSAFALNNWNENRRDRVAERKILSEISIGLDQDVHDLEINQLGHDMGLRSVHYFQDLLSDQPVDLDSFGIQFYRLTRDFISVQNTSGYETLKSRGLELIEDDVLRSDIITMYESDYFTLKKLEEDYYESQFQVNYYHRINDLFAPHIDFFEGRPHPVLTSVPHLTDADRRAMLSYLWKIKSNRLFINRLYDDIINKNRSLKERVDEYLGIE